MKNKLLLKTKTVLLPYGAKKVAKKMIKKFSKKLKKV